MPAEFLSDQEAAAFGRYGGSVPVADLERFFYLDDTDRKLVAGQREDHNRLGFSVQLATVRYMGYSQDKPETRSGKRFPWSEEVPVNRAGGLPRGWSRASEKGCR